MRQYLYKSLIHGLGLLTSFIAVNTVLALANYTVYPRFFQLQMLYNPDILLYSSLLSIAFYLNIRYLKDVFEDEDDDSIINKFDEVKPQF